MEGLLKYFTFRGSSLPMALQNLDSARSVAEAIEKHCVCWLDKYEPM
jgi:hypothetical protein